MKILSIEDLMQHMRDEVEPKSTILPEAALARLQERAALMQSTEIPFQPGDLVQIRQDAPLNKHADFYLVVEIDPDAPRNPNKPGIPYSRQRDNVYAIALVNDVIVGFWMAHYYLEPYTFPTT